MSNSHRIITDILLLSRKLLLKLLDSSSFANFVVSSGVIPPPPIRLHGVVLSEAQGQLYLYLYYNLLEG